MFRALAYAPGLSKQLVAVLEQMVQRSAAAADQRSGSRASTATGSRADAGANGRWSGDCQDGFQLGTAASSDGRARRTIDYGLLRSEERRVGKEWRAGGAAA